MKLTIGSVAFLCVWVAAVVWLAGSEATWASVVLDALAKLPGMILILRLVGIPSAEPNVSKALEEVYRRLGSWKVLGLLALWGGNAWGVRSLSEQSDPWSVVALCVLAVLPGIAVAGLMSWRAKLRARGTSTGQVT